MRHRFLAIVALAPIVAGCPPEIIPLKSASRIERSYTLGETRTAPRGESMVVVRSFTDAPLYEVAFDYTPPQHDIFSGGLDYPPLRKGTRFVQVATRSDGTIGLGRAGYGVTRPGSITNRETFLPVTIWVTPQGVVAGSMEGKRWTTDVLFLPTRRSGESVEAARMEIAYDGVTEGMLDLTYREYFGDPSIATESRPIRFDISTEKRIAHNGLEIEIVEATPDAVRYRVTGDERLIWGE